MWFRSGTRRGRRRYKTRHPPRPPGWGAGSPAVGEAWFAEDPVAAVEDRIDHPEMLVHVLPELLAAHLKDVPGPAGPCLHLLEHPPLTIVAKHRRDLRDHVAPHALLEDLVAPVFQHGGQAFLTPWIEGRLGTFAFEEVRNVVPQDRLPLPDQGGHGVLPGRLDELRLVVIGHVLRVERDALEGEHAVGRDAVVADGH